MRWNIKHPEPVENIDDVLKILLENRGIDKDFLREYTVDDLPDPMTIFDMDKCVTRIQKAIDNKEKIYIHGDFDVDGTAATAILWSYLYRVKNADVMPYIPHRVDEGYGISKKTLDTIIAEGAKLIISVDCGVKDIELVEYAKSHGVDVIISDHHEFVRNEADEPVLPDTIVIHGMHPKSKNPLIICGGVTAWMIVCALEYTYTGYGYTKDSLKFVDLAAITTLSDIMPLKGVNRIIVSLGLQYMRGGLVIPQGELSNEEKNEMSIGLLELCKIAAVEPINLDTYHVGFVLGPRLNAPGRVENSAINSLRLLCTESPSKAKELAKHLDELNKKRQDMTELYMREVEKQIDLDENKIVKSKIIFAHGTDWPEGIVGLVAGKIAEKYYRPTLVMSFNIHENKVTGSARSIKNFHLVKALDECKDELVRFGGHYMAAGYTLEPSKIESFREKITAVANKILTDEDIIPESNIDCVLTGEALFINLHEKIRSLSPFGYGNTTPIFASLKAELIDVKYMGANGQHAKFVWSVDGNVVESVAFNISDRFRKLEIGKPYDISYNVDVNEWNGKRTLQLGLKDVISLKPKNIENKT